MSALWGRVVALIALLATGPVLVALPDIMRVGPTSLNLPFALPAVGLYLFWVLATLVLKPRPGERFEAGCLLFAASVVLTFGLVWAASLIPVRIDEGDYGLFFAAVLYYPVLLVQYVAFVAIWAWTRRDARGVVQAKP